jgi:hypothetical protein
MTLPDSTSKLKVGVLVSHKHTDAADGGATGIVMAIPPETNLHGEHGDVRVRWFEYKGRASAVATHYEYELLLLKGERRDSALAALKRGFHERMGWY